jgi:formate-dependent phosphoribosylglycinamide formyltransferase (GAR transformylase)
MSMNVVFVVPFAMKTSLRFVSAVAALPGVRLGLLTMQPVEQLPAHVRERIAGHWQLDDCFDPQQIANGVRLLQERMGGPVRRILAALEQLQVPIAQARDALGIPGANEEAARNFREKSRMKTVFERAGVPCARHRQVASAADGLAFAGEVGYPLVVKPPAGAGSKATFRVNDEKQLREALAVHRPGPGRETLIEEFVQGSEYSFETISIGGRPVWHSLSHYLPGALEVVETPWIQWCVMVPREIDHPHYDDIRRIAAHALDALGMDTGITHMEWFRRADGSIAVSEVAMRPPGSHIVTLHSYAHDFDLYAAWAKVVVYGEFDVPERRYASGAAFFRGQSDGRVKAVHGLDKAQKAIEALGVDVVETRLPVPGQPKSSHYEGEGYVIIRHPETAVVHAALGSLVSNVRVEMA